MDRRQLHSSEQRGFMLVELMIAMAIIFALASIAMPIYGVALQRGRQASLTAEGNKLFNGLMAYYSDNAVFPSEDDFDTTTLDPLASAGYLSNAAAVVQPLVNDQLLLYIAPDVGGPDQQFIAIMQHDKDPEVIIAVVYTNVVDEDSEWYEGVFVITPEDLADSGL